MSNVPDQAQLHEVAGRARWHRDPRRTLGAARGIYMRLPGDARLWLRRRQFIGPDAGLLGAALGTAG